MKKGSQSIFMVKAVSFVIAVGMVIMLFNVMHNAYSLYFGTEEKTSQTVSTSPAVEQEDDTSQSVAQLMEQLKNNPNDATALYELGKIFYDGKDFSRASNFLSRAVLSNPSDTKIRYWLALSLNREGRYAESAETLEGLLSLEKQPETMYNLAIMYKYRLSKKDKAKALLQELSTMERIDSHLLMKIHKELDTNS